MNELDQRVRDPTTVRPGKPTVAGAGGDARTEDSRVSECSARRRHPVCRGMVWNMSNHSQALRIYCRGEFSDRMLRRCAASQGTDRLPKVHRIVISNV